MTKEKYIELNNYLNDCLIYLENMDGFLLANLYNIGHISSNYIEMLEKYDLSPKEIKYDYLTFEEVYLLAREIIESISPKYLPIYDELIKKGTLEFNYGDQKFDSLYKSFFRWEYKNNTHNLSINITRKFNYSEVCVLVHEFMHMMNFSELNTYNHYLFTEFISIYFEEYARIYLLNKGIKKEQLNFNERIIATNQSASRIEEYSIILLAYQNFGSINEKSCEFLKEYLGINIPQEELDKMCQSFLAKIKEVESEYKKRILYVKKFDDKELAEEVCKCLGINVDYKYVIGTLLAYYQLKYSDKEIMREYSEHINDKAIPPVESLESIGINLNKINLLKFIEVIEENVQNNNIKKVIK